jgi:hypothetical protein
MPNPRRAQIMLEAQATWLELEAAVRSLMAAALRNDAAAAEAARRLGQALLDRHLDLKVEGTTAIRLDVEQQIRRG